MEAELKSETPIRGGVHVAQRHDSAHKHVTGLAEYCDDIAEPAGTLHAYLGLSDRAHAEILSMDLDAVRAAPGVVGVLTGADIPGHNDISPVGKHDDPVFVEGTVEFHGQPLFAVIAETRDAARRATKLAKVEYRDLPHVTDVAAAIDADYPFVTEPLKLERGDVAPALAAAPHRLKGRMRVGGQDHFYLEGMIAFAIPGEDDDVTVYSSTQHPSEVQHMVAHVLGVPSNAVTIIVRRMGGGFGGKETQPNLFASIAAVAAKKWNRAVKLRPDRDDDMVATGKRHDFLNDYEVGFDDDGAHPRRRRHLRRPLRLLRRPLRPGHRPRALPRRQRLLLPGGQARLQADEDQHRLQHRLPRLRRPAGPDHRRADHGGDRLRARQGPARGPPRQLLRRHRPQRHPLPPDRHRQRHRPDRRRARHVLGLHQPAARRSSPTTPRAA